MAPFNKSGNFRGGNDRPSGFRTGSDRPRFGGKPSFSRGRDDRGGQSDRPVQMFAATCAECHKACEVPFRPNGEKPVFCRDCFGDKRGNTQDDRRAPSRDFTPRDYDRAPAPHQKSQADPRIDDLKRQMDGVTKKLDTLTHLIEGLTHSAPAPVARKETKNVESLAKVVKKVAKKAAKVKK